jgi:hypothetical protein
MEFVSQLIITMLAAICRPDLSNFNPNTDHTRFQTLPQSNSSHNILQNNNTKTFIDVP